jgi:hypothetical protein
LLEHGISGFVAHNDIEPTREWQTEILKALETCDALVALLHPEFHASAWTDQEVGYAMGRGIPVCAVRLDSSPYGFIGRYQAFDGNGKTTTVLARELFESYRRNRLTKGQMGGAPLTYFQQSKSYAAARERLGYLEELETWKPAFTSKLKAALLSNDQISNSYGVPDRIKSLIEKWEQRGVAERKPGARA